MPPPFTNKNHPRANSPPQNITCGDAETSLECSDFTIGGGIACALINNVPTIVGEDRVTNAGVPSQCVSPLCSCSDPPPPTVAGSGSLVPTEFGPPSTSSSSNSNSIRLQCLGQFWVGGQTMSIQDYCENTVGARCLSAHPARIVSPPGADKRGICGGPAPEAGLMNTGCTCLDSTMSG